MLAGFEDLLRLIREVYGTAEPPRPFRLLLAVQQVRSGQDLRTVAGEVRTTHPYLRACVEAVDPIAQVLRVSLPSLSPESLARARANLGQLLLGSLAERAFEKMYREMMGTHALRLTDHRRSRDDTDYRVLNGESRPVFRINIKFHGTLFRQARELVQLEPEDCFALATYKIHQAILKQEEEHLPYLFVIVGVPGLTGELVGRAVPDDLVHLCGLVSGSNMTGKRDVEDRAVECLLEASVPAAVRMAISEFAARIESAEWRVLSARKAALLLREKLFERVFAVRVRAFARNYRSAELDMHFSLREDLTPLRDYLALLKEHGVHGMATRLERGTI